MRMNAARPPSSAGIGSRLKMPSEIDSSAEYAERTADEIGKPTAGVDRRRR